MTTPTPEGALTIVPLRGIPEVVEGDDLVDVIEAGLVASGFVLADGDIVVLSSKVASKSLGLVTHDPDKDRVVAAESTYVVAERAGAERVTRVVRAKAGPIMAAAGVDGSNTGERGGWLLLPHDPDAVCRSLHSALAARHRVSLGVVLTDTAGRPWRVGQVDFALGAHGLDLLDDLRGGVDADGRPLAVTTRNLADELAAAADLVKGKATGVPAAVVRGLGGLVHGRGNGRGNGRGDGLGEDAPSSATTGGRDLVRTGPTDWFGYGRVEAVRAALGVEPGSALSSAVGIPPVAGDTRQGAISRAVAVALQGAPTGTADVGPQHVTVGADTPYELGILTARLQAALWCDWLTGEPGTTSADGLSVVVTVRALHTRSHP